MASFFRQADTVGDGTGTKNAAVNGSVTPVKFILTPRTGERSLRIYRLLGFVVDTGTFDSGSYGNGITMTNGITMKHIDDSNRTILDFMDGDPVLKNPDWKRLCYDATVSSYGVGDEALAVRWTFTNSGPPISIPFGDRIEIEINDDLTGLVNQRFTFEGAVKS